MARTNLEPVIFRCLLRVSALLVIASGANINHASAQVSDEIQLSIGFQRQAKLGCWLPFNVTTPDRMEPKRFEIQVLDGDDTPVTYHGELSPISGELNQHQGWVKIGRTYGGIQLRLLDVHDQVVGEHSFRLTGADGVCELHESTRSMVLVLEQGEEVSSAVDSTAVDLGRRQRSIVVGLNSTGELPLRSFGYQGVDTIFLVTSDADRLSSITRLQWDALEQWVEDGGRLIFSAAAHCEMLLSETGVLNRFNPGTFEQQVQLTESGRLESFANNGQLIPRGGDPIPIAHLTNVDGQVVVEEGEYPLIIRQARGFGEIVFVAFDLDSPRIVRWPGYGNLVQRLTTRVDTQEAAQSQTSDTRGSSVSHFGYEDLIGQLRVPLDRFSSVGFVTFTWIAVLIGVYILLIGPGDYYFLRNITGRMELTWITFPLLSLLFCGLAFWISTVTRPDEIQVNQLEIVDFDGPSGHVRGTLWANLYSPESSNCDVRLARQTEMGFDLESDLISWHGLPGDGLGGMQTRVSAGSQRLQYDHWIEPLGDGDFTSSMKNIPLNVSSTKPVFGQWNARFPEPMRSRLVLARGSARLEGTVTNPLPVPIRNVRILFETYAYSLKKELLEPGETIDILSETKERTVKSFLTRRTKKSEKDNRSHNSPWDPRDTRVARIAEMMMFYEAAGAENYTGLTHAYQGYVDMSHHLDLKRAVLVGEIDDVVTTLQVDDQPATERYDHHDTVVRIVFPVTYQTSQTNR